MAINAADKIFVDVDDEINFIVEKILQCPKERVILVLPQNALVLSSLVSMKILAKQIAKSKKILILVTEDSFGLELAERSEILATRKVSNITPEMWEASLIKKQRFLAGLDSRKKQLLTERGILPKPALEPSTEETVRHEEEKLPEAEEPTVEEKKPEEPELQPEPSLELEASSNAEADKGNELSVEDIPKEEEISQEVSEVEGETVVGAIKRARKEPKLVSLGKFQVLAGGDISSLKTSGNANIGPTLRESETMEGDSRTRSTRSKSSVAGFTGRDWTKYTGSRPALGFDFKKLLAFRFGKPGTPGERKVKPIDEQEASRKRKAVIIALLLFLGLFLGGSYVLAFKLSSVEVVVTLKTAQVPVEQQITADTEVSVIDTTTLTIPAEQIKDDSLSSSVDDTATGTGQRGQKAAGLIDIWNKTTNQVQIARGTVLQNTTSNLKYILQQDVTVPAAEYSSGILQKIAEVRDVRIEAEAFGENYNITEAGTKVDFKVNDYSVEEVLGKRFRNIEGGTTESFQAVSEDDVARVKESLVASLTTQASAKIRNLVPAGYRLLEGTEEFIETETTSYPGIGEEATTFSVSVKGEAVAIVVKESDLETAVGILIERNQDEEEEFQIDNLNDVVITDAVKNDNQVTFTVTSSGNLKSKLTKDTIAQAIAGLSFKQASEYLADLDQVSKFKLDFSPAIVPEALRQVPTDLSRIKVRLQ